MTKRHWIALSIAALVLPPLLLAQAPQQFQWGRRGGDRIRNGFPDDEGYVDRRFTFCRLVYRQVRRENAGTGWDTDYPNADINFPTRLSQLTTAGVSVWEDGQPGSMTLDATDPRLFECPFLFASDVGTVGLDPGEVEALRSYLLKGGFLWADDFWGEAAWRHWEGQITAVLPEYPIVEVDLSHAMMTSVYEIAEIPQIPSIQQWRRMGRTGTSERGSESAEPDVRGIFDEHGRLLVLMTHDTDIADGWEREGEEELFFDTFSPAAYSFGVNVLVWTMAK